MQCPVCRGGTKVLDSRDGRDDSVRRRRQCLGCGHRFTTRERIEESYPFVVKRDGRKQSFDSPKILRGLELACRKRPIAPEDLQRTVHDIEQWAIARGDREIQSNEIGEQIMHALYRLDPVAYVRFVSVYRSFDSIAEFAALLARMQKAEEVDPEGQRQLFGAHPTADAADEGPDSDILHEDEVTS